ncbi:ATP-binding protein [Candidatus Parabeggiatoa sp. HSG14]|uniref:PAS domain-containing sensor histidine kinase n=1 Tax=Candidatus Parabeggiatoa sp. HSG14 TaxID=3055593 RepID=UPI0025A71066|nr:ATP-binding protein [Thiotrichales bacterium HSG14]
MSEEISLNKETLLELEKLHQRVKELEEEKAALEVLLEMTTEHTDAVEDDLVRESEDRLAQFMDAVPVGVFVMDVKGQLDFVNQRAQQLLGKDIMPNAQVEQLFKSSQFYSAGTDQLYPNDNHPGLRALKGETTSVDDIEIHRSDKTIPIEVWATPIFSDFDKKYNVAYAIVAFQDITDRKRAEEERLRFIQEREAKNAAWRLNKEITAQKEELAHTLEQLQTTRQKLIDAEKMVSLGQLIASIAHEINTPLGAIRSSANNITSFFNQTLEELPTFFQVFSSEHQQYFFTLLQKSLQSEINLSPKEKRRFKRTLVHQLEENAITDAMSIADTLVDIGIYKESDIFLPLLKNSESIKLLNTVYQLVSLKKGIQTITIAADRAVKIVLALKSFARYDHSGEKVKTNLTEGIETALILYHNQIKHGVEVIKDYTDLPPILCYPDELNQVWTNLVHNALQAMDNKGTLQIESLIQDNQVILKFTDSGQGISDKIKVKIFEPFFTTKPAGEGNGLGLDIVKKIIEKHEGRIEVESQPGKTTFTIFLPFSK